MKAAVEALEIGIEVSEELKLKYSLAAAFSVDPDQVGPCDRQELELQMDWSPPSLYLFGPGDEPWVGVSAESRIERREAREFAVTIGDVYLLTFRDRHEEKKKSLWIVAQQDATPR